MKKTRLLVALLAVASFLPFAPSATYAQSFAFGKTFGSDIRLMTSSTGTDITI